MSGQVDVLEVLDHEIQRTGGEAYQSGRDLIESRAAVAALIAERDALRETLRDIATNCRRGAHEYGMTQHGVSAIAAMCDAALTTGESA